MCGIFGIVSAPIDPDRLRRPAGLPAPDDALPDLKKALATLDFYRVHQAYGDADALARWQAIAGRLDEETGDTSGTEEMRRDVVWRIEHDLLDLLGAIEALLEDPDRRARGSAVWLAWQVELTLRALGRLEVRGRDSAGVSIMLWYDDAETPRHLTAEPAPHPQISRHAVPGSSCLVLTYRVAEEVGALGYNESTIRALARGDATFQRAVRANPRQAIVLAHTRWASNGIISLDNAHPVDGSLGAPGGEAFPPGRTLAVLNGDVDNHLELLPSIEVHGTISAGVTTDAKVIPAMVEIEQAAAGLDAAFAATMERIEGSVAIAVARADRPGTLWCGLKGTGQALYLAAGGDVMVVASEVYGSAELTDRYWPMELARERRADGRDAVMLAIEAPDAGRPRVRHVPGETPSGETPASALEPDYRVAEITTRDVDRGSFTHFFRKELEESVLSARKTIAGRYRRSGNGHRSEPAVDFAGLYSFPGGSSPGGGGEELFGALRGDALRRLVFVGQGSAHVAGQVGARFVAEVVENKGRACLAMTAGDFSAHELRSDLSDTCLVAISQSGTTTDTNRCLALARERGARVVGIVNRRNSAMVELCDAVIYTSDGRDVEMAVASTKAFYSQVVASFMLAQHVGLVTGALIPNQVTAALMELERLPDVMQAAFDIEPAVAECARAVALKRRHWSLLGSGASIATAEEIRIKFSELCYKSVSVDLLENKKHIDLSSEPLILAALHDLRGDLVSDAVKEVSIFAAHRAITVALCDRDGDLYGAHTPHVLEVPPIGYGLGAVTTAIVGHLFAYHTAVAMDAVAQRLRGLRKAVLAEGVLAGGGTRAARSFEVAEEARALLAELLRGDLDALWPARSAARLAATFQILAGAADTGATARLASLLLASDDEADTALEIDEWCRNQLSTAIADSSRPIDSIRHQAKTITVGTSRSGYSRTSVMGSALAALGVGVEDLPMSLHTALAAVDDMLREIPSGIRYALERDGRGLRLRVAEKIGLARGAASRFEDGAPLAGTKATAVRRRQPMVVEGVRDGARLLVFPVLQRGEPVEVVLLHLDLGPQITEPQKRRFLEAFPQRAEQLAEHFGEILGREVDLGDLARLDAEAMVFAPPALLREDALEAVAVS